MACKLRLALSLTKTRDKRINGLLDEVLTSSESHPHGIMVKLKSGEVGRVKELGGSTGWQEDIARVTPDFSSFEEMLENDEEHPVEFKENLLWSSNLSQEDIQKGDGLLKQYGKHTSKIIVARAIAGFLNTDGGCLILGVKENKNNLSNEVPGIECEFPKLKDKCEDGYRRLIVEGVIEKYLPSFVLHNFSKYLLLEFVKYKNGIVCLIRVKKSDQKVFVNISGAELFLIRVDASFRQLKGESIVDYCVERFG